MLRSFSTTTCSHQRALHVAAWAFACAGFGFFVGYYANIRRDFRAHKAEFRQFLGRWLQENYRVKERSRGSATAKIWKLTSWRSHLHFGVYNFVRKHTTLKTTPAVAAGIEEKPWDLELVIEMTADYMRRKEDAEFEKAFAEMELA